MTILMSCCVDDPGSELDNVTAGELVVVVEVACDVGQSPHRAIENKALELD